MSQHMYARMSYEGLRHLGVPALGDIPLLRKCSCPYWSARASASADQPPTSQPGPRKLTTPQQSTTEPQVNLYRKSCPARHHPPLSAASGTTLFRTPPAADNPFQKHNLHEILLKHPIQSTTPNTLPRSCSPRLQSLRSRSSRACPHPLV